MSADNWDVCCACRQRAEAEAQALRDEATAAYGKLPVEEWEALRDRAAEPLDREKFRTFREDYEIYGAEEGTVIVVYSGSCSKCGSAAKFRHEHPVVAK